VNRGDFLAGAGSLALSIVVNATAMVAVDHTALFQGIGTPAMTQAAMRARQQKDEDMLRFEFVEAPPKTNPREPKDTVKIAARDALNQDASKAPTNDPAAGPAVEQKGIADQLAQTRAAAPSAPPPPKIETPKEEKRAVPPTPQTPELPPPPDPLALKEMPIPDQLPAPPPQEKSEARPAAPPSEASKQGVPGHDRITTEEMTRTDSHGAALFGMTSFEATGSGMGEYMKNLKEKIWLSWFPYIAFKYPTDFKTADAVLSITLDRDGRVALVRVVESQGSTVFASFCLKAVQEASPFGPLPPEILALIGKDELEIKFGFHYH